MKKLNLEPTARSLHLLAMALMLCDHVGLALLPEQTVLRCIGRLAFPIFAFLAVEGYQHTRNLKGYLLRLLAAAVLSELPFDLLCSGRLFDPLHQNVLWTILIGLGTLYLADSAKSGREGAAAAAALLLGAGLALAGRTDYGCAGVMTILIFWIFRERSWKNRAMQAFLLWIVHGFLLAGPAVPVLGFWVGMQTLALGALAPIWLYRGRQGCHSRGFRLLCYGFYPAHMLVLALIRMYR